MFASASISPTTASVLCQCFASAVSMLRWHLRCRRNGRFYVALVKWLDLQRLICTGVTGEYNLALFSFNFKRVQNHMELRQSRVEARIDTFVADDSDDLRAELSHGSWTRSLLHHLDFLADGLLMP